MFMKQSMVLVEFKIRCRYHLAIMRACYCIDQCCHSEMTCPEG